jgi:replication factor C subunit 3/5
MFTTLPISTQKNNGKLNTRINCVNTKNANIKSSKKKIPKIETTPKPIYSFYKKINNNEHSETDDYDEDNYESNYESNVSNNKENDSGDDDRYCIGADMDNMIPKNVIIKPNINIIGGLSTLSSISSDNYSYNNGDSINEISSTTKSIDVLEGVDSNTNISFKTSTPWVEKYRPSNFEDIVLDPLNKTLLKNIIDNNYFPNLLFYGPPGTGKTTTIINLVNVYQEKMNLKNKGLMIHLNASDERGIDIIRNQINSFVNSKSLFGDGMKFVILDEVDYMTKTAQIALRYLLNNYNNNFNVRFCLICNYISRIDESLQTEFVRMRFNQLPERDILKFLQKINTNENLNIKSDILVSIQKHFMSDIRSMINYMQSNQDLIRECKIIKNDLWIKLTASFKKNAKHQDILKKINKISRDYNMEQKNIIKNYLNYIIRTYPITPEFLYNIENIMHIQDCKTDHILNYIIYKLRVFFGKNDS